MEIKFKDGQKKIKFYDFLLWISLASLTLPVIAFFSSISFSGLIAGILTTFVFVFVFTFAIFYIGMLYWMILTKNYLLFVLSMLMGFITILFYFGRMRKKYFKEGEI